MAFSPAFAGSLAAQRFISATANYNLPDLVSWRSLDKNGNDHAFAACPQDNFADSFFTRFKAVPLTAGFKDKALKVAEAVVNDLTNLARVGSLFLLADDADRGT